METGSESPVTINACPACGSKYAQDVRLCPEDGNQLIRQMPDPLIGMLLPRHYRITGKLGRGAMSVVYRGLYEPLEQPVAIKLLKSHLVSDTQTFKRFQQEAKTAGALEHPNIVGIFDFGVTEQGVPYLIMELLNGESLGQYLKREKCMPIETALDVFLQAADALEYTHQRSIIHRDVKPSNLLLLNNNGRTTVKIVDFGIAKLQSYEGNPALNLTATGEVFGTPLYVSPEQATGKNIDARADIYSLGCVMYEAIVGRPAFSAPTAFDVIRLQITADPMPMNKARPDLDLPPPLVAAVTRSMAKNPDDRYQSMADLLVDLQRAQSLTATARISVGKQKSTAQNEWRNSKDTNALNQPRSSSPTSSSALNSSSRVTPISLNASDSANIRTSEARVQSDNFSFTFFRSLALAATAGILVGLVITLCVHSDLLSNSFSGKHSQQLSSFHIYTKSEENADAEGKLLEMKAAQLFARREFAAAAKQQQEAINIFKQKGQRQSEAIAYSDLCQIQLEQGELTLAARSAQKAIDVLSRLPDAEPLNLAVAKESLAQVAVAQRHLQDAEKLFNEALTLKQSALPKNDPEIAKTMHSLAVTEQLLCKYHQAEDLYTRALGIRKQSLGPESAEYATTLTCLGTLYYEEKFYGMAETRLEQALSIDIKNADETALGRDYACLAQLYGDQKKTTRAEQAFRAALASSEKVYGHGNAKLVPRMQALAQFLKRQHKDVEADAIERTARTISASYTSK